MARPYFTGRSFFKRETWHVENTFKCKKMKNMFLTILKLKRFFLWRTDSSLQIDFAKK